MTTVLLPSSGVRFPDAISQRNSFVEKICTEWLGGMALLDTSFTPAVERVERTYILVAGLEREFASKLESLVSELTSRLAKNQSLASRMSTFAVNSESFTSRASVPSREDFIKHMLERNVYNALHPFLWNHFTNDPEYKKRESTVEEYRTVVISPSVDRRGGSAKLSTVHVDEAAAIIKKLDSLTTPHDKLDVIAQLHTFLKSCLQTTALASDANSPLEYKSSERAGNDELVAAIVHVIAAAKLKNVVSHIAHVAMMLSQRPVTVGPPCSQFQLFCDAAWGMLRDAPSNYDDFGRV